MRGERSRAEGERRGGSEARKGKREGGGTKLDKSVGGGGLFVGRWGKTGGAKEGGGLE